MFSGMCCCEGWKVTDIFKDCRDYLFKNKAVQDEYLFSATQLWELQISHKINTFLKHNFWVYSLFQQGWKKVTQILNACLLHVTSFKPHILISINWFLNPFHPLHIPDYIQCFGNSSVFIHHWKDTEVHVQPDLRDSNLTCLTPR